MREIRFRGKCIEDCELKGQWLYGHYLKSASHFIAVDQGLVDGHFKLYQVDPETVGQYTGLKDKNGKEIYEGDIIRSKTYLGETLVIKWDNAYTGFYCHDKTDEEENHLNMLEVVESEVIGNIFENPELLKGEESECNH